jgi:hypothetical protein
MFETLARNTRSIIAWAIVNGTIIFDFMLFFKEFPGGNEKLLYTAFGSLNTAMVGVITYYFGSSKDKSDREKAEDSIKVSQAENNK